MNAASRPPLLASFAMTAAALMTHSARPGTQNLLLAALFGLALAHLHVRLGHPPSARLRLMRPVSLAYCVWLAPTYGVPLVAGGYLVIATILRLLDGSHFRDPRGSLLLALVGLALGLLQRQSSLVALWLLVFAVAAEAFHHGAGPLGARRVLSAAGWRAPLAPLCAAAAVALLLFLAAPRTALGIYLFRGGIPAYTGRGIGLDDLDDLRLSNDVMMRVRLSRRANVYFRGRSFNIYSPATRRWHAMPIRRADVPRGEDGLARIPRFTRTGWAVPDEGLPLEQEYWLTAHLFGAFFSVYAPESTTYPAAAFETDDLENVRPTRAAAGPVNYVVSSRLPPPATEGMRALLAPPAGPTILAYLQVPSQLRRLKRLAREVAGDLPTVLDRALAIERYLRENYEYSLALSPYRRHGRADGEDPVEAFLFDHRFGHCELFASAMVLMCREVGVPARLTEGFAGGEYVEGDDYVIVRGRDAHAWVEVYFHGFGWYAFDPTGFRAAGAAGNGSLGWLGRLADRVDFLFDRFVNCYDPAFAMDLLRRAAASAAGVARRAAGRMPESPLLRLALRAAGCAAFTLLLIMLLLRRGGRGILARLPGAASWRARLVAAHPLFARRAGYGPDDFFRFLADEAAAAGCPKAPHETPRAFARRLPPPAAAPAATAAALHAERVYRERLLSPAERRAAWAAARDAAGRLREDRPGA